MTDKLTETKQVTVHDELTGSLKDSDGIEVSEDGDTSIYWDSVETVTIDSVPIAEHFETKQFYKIPATVARPITQPYAFNDGDTTLLLKKPAAELQKAAWSLDNKPWTMDHPNTDSGMVKSVDDIRGFWRNPRWIDSLEDLDADLHIPVNDEEAQSYIANNGDVSVGFRNTVVPFSMYDSADEDETFLDGYQTDMYFDHVASVGIGRCPSERGCGVSLGDSTDSDIDHTHGAVSLDEDIALPVAPSTKEATDGTVVDETTSYISKEDQTVHEQDIFRDRERAQDRAEELGCDSVHKMGEMFIPCDSTEMYQLMVDGACDDITDCPWARKESVDVELTDAIDVSETPEEAVGLDTNDILHVAQCIDAPNCEPSSLEDVSSSLVPLLEETSDCDEYDNTSDTYKEYITETADELERLDDYLNQPLITTESRDETNCTTDTADEDDGYFAIKADETSGDDPKYPINTCNDVTDAWNLRNHGDYTVSVETLEERIKNRASELQCSDETKPWVDSETDSNTTMTDEDISDLEVTEIVDSHDGVATMKDELDEKAETIATLKDTFDVGEDESLLDEASKAAELAAEGAEYRETQIDEHVEVITDLTDRYEEDELREKKLSHLSEIRAVVEDAAESASATDSVANSGTSRTETQTNDGVVDSPWE